MLPVVCSVKNFQPTNLQAPRVLGLVTAVALAVISIIGMCLTPFGSFAFIASSVGLVAMLGVVGGVLFCRRPTLSNITDRDEYIRRLQEGDHFVVRYNLGPPNPEYDNNTELDGLRSDFITHTGAIDTTSFEPHGDKVAGEYDSVRLQRRLESEGMNAPDVSDIVTRFREARFNLVRGQYKDNPNLWLRLNQSIMAEPFKVLNDYYSNVELNIQVTEVSSPDQALSTGVFRVKSSEDKLFIEVVHIFKILFVPTLTHPSEYAPYFVRSKLKVDSETGACTFKWDPPQITCPPLYETGSSALAS